MDRQEIIDNIIEKANTYSTNTQKLRYVYDWFVENVKYAHDYLFLAETESYFAEKFFGDASDKNQRNAQFLLFSLKNACTKNFDDTLSKIKKDGKITFSNIEIMSPEDIELARKYWKISYKPNFDCFEQKRGVCDTIASDFKKICDLLNIPCAKVVGTTLAKNVLHAWNAVSLDGKVLHIDITYAIFDKEQGKPDETRFFLTTESQLLKNSERVISDKSKQDLKIFSEENKYR